jgi:hypothetical protein
MEALRSAYKIENLNGRDRSGDPGVDGNPILERTLEK